MAFGWKQYWKPTPKNIRKFADALSAASLAISAYSFMSDYKLFAYITLVTTFVAKFLSNFFSAENEGRKNT
jgi:hypothetical protein